MVRVIIFIGLAIAFSWFCRFCFQFYGKKWFLENPSKSKNVLLLVFAFVFLIIIVYGNHFIVHWIGSGSFK